MTEFVDSLIDKRFTGTRYHMIKLVMGYLEHIGDEMGKYAPRIQATMLKCVNTDQSDKTKALALQCLDRLYLSTRIKLHANASRGVDSAALPIEQVISTLYSNLNLGVSKLRPSVRGGILRLLGILSNRFASKFERSALQKLAKLYTKHINEALQRPDAVQPQLVGGSLTGLEYFLEEHCDLIPVSPSTDPRFSAPRRLSAPVNLLADTLRGRDSFHGDAATGRGGRGVV